MPSWSMSCSVRPPGCGLVTSTSSTSRSVRSLAKASSRVAMPFIGASALAMARIRPWHARRRSAGAKHVVDAEQDHLHPGRVDAEVAGDVARGGLRRA